MHFVQRRAFTLIELLVVVAIIGLLSTVAVVSLGSARMNARNIKRKADLTQISKALELYYADHDAYPIAGSFHGSCSSYGSYSNDASRPWIPGLVPNYMAILPSDPTTGKRNITVGGCSGDTRACYLYTSDGTGYKVMAFCTPEGGWTSADSFYDPKYTTTGWTVYTPNFIDY